MIVVSRRRPVGSASSASPTGHAAGTADHTGRPRLRAGHPYPLPLLAAAPGRPGPIHPM